MKPRTPLINRFFAILRRPWLRVSLSLLLVLIVFIGGITFSLVIGGVQQSNLQGIGFWLSYAPIVAAPVIIFFL